MPKVLLAKCLSQKSAPLYHSNHKHALICQKYFMAKHRLVLINQFGLVSSFLASQIKIYLFLITFRFDDLHFWWKGSYHSRKYVLFLTQMLFMIHATFVFFRKDIIMNKSCLNSVTKPNIRGCLQSMQLEWKTHQSNIGVHVFFRDSKIPSSQT